MRSQEKSDQNQATLHKWMVRLAWVTLIGYVLFMIWQLFFHAYFSYSRRPLPFVDYNLVPLKSILNYMVHIGYLPVKIWFVNLFGNVLAFMPLGFLVAMIWTSMRRGKRIFWLTFGVSLSVELLQAWFRVGTFDVDDVILNMAGGVLGFYVWKWVRKGYLGWRKKERENG